MCAQHLPYGYQPRDVERYAQGTEQVQLLFADGFAVVQSLKEQGQQFDIIVMDLPDEECEPSGQHNRLYDQEFLNALNALLTEDGVVISQAGCASYWRNQTLMRTYQRFSSVFQTTVYFELTEQDWVWVIGCRAALADPVAHMQQRLTTLPYTPQYIDKELIAAATTLPTGLRRLLGHTA